jgi:hypothetical protein
MKQGLNEVGYRFLTFFALFNSWLGNAQSERRGKKFQRLGTFIFGVLAVVFWVWRKASERFLRRLSSVSILSDPPSVEPARFGRGFGVRRKSCRGANRTNPRTENRKGLEGSSPRGGPLA